MEKYWKNLSELIISNRSLENVFKIIDLFLIILRKDVDDTLNIIKDNTSKLIHVKLKSGLDLLSDAKSIWNVDKQKYFQYIDEARLAFIDAHNLESIPYKTRALEYVALCHECLGNIEIAKNKYEESYNELIDNQEQYAKMVRRFIDYSMKYIVLDVFTLITLLGVFVHFVWADKYFKNLEIVFKLEMQLRHLEVVLNKYKIPIKKYNAIFSEDVCSIKKEIDGGFWSLLDQKIICYDSFNNVIEYFEYRKHYMEDRRGLWRRGR